jgi:sugar-specific transcriptional regulator TrmB
MFETLIKLGLSDKEAKVYLAALKLGSAPASKIAETAQVNRPTTYVILEKLAGMGLITNFDKDKIQYFTAESPDALRQLVDQQKVVVEGWSRELDEHLPQLKALFGQTDRPRVLMYDSPAAGEAYFHEKLQKGDVVYSFTDLDALNSEEAKVDPTRRVARGISTKVIYTRDAGPVIDATNEAELREAKYVSRSRFPFSAVIATSPRVGAIFMKDSKTQTLVVVENKILSESIKAIFDLLWAEL